MGTSDNERTKLREQQFLWLREVEECRPHVEACRNTQTAMDQAVKKKLDAATTNLIRSCQAFVVTLAHKYIQRFSLPVIVKPQLKAAGDEGAWRAAITFDFKHETVFITWAQWWIRSAMQHWILHHARGRRLPAQVISMPKKVQEIIEKTDPSTFTGAARLERYTLNCDFSLDQTDFEAEGGGSAAIENIADPEKRNPLDTLVSDERSRAVKEAIAQLPKEQTRRIMEARFDGLTLADAGKLYHLSRERARQIEERGIEQIRRILRRAKFDLKID